MLILYTLCGFESVRKPCQACLLQLCSRYSILVQTVALHQLDFRGDLIDDNPVWKLISCHHDKYTHLHTIDVAVACCCTTAAQWYGIQAIIFVAPYGLKNLHQLALCHQAVHLVLPAAGVDLSWHNVSHAAAAPLVNTCTTLKPLQELIQK